MVYLFLADPYETSKLADCKSLSYRAVKLIIDKEKIVLLMKIPSKGSWEDDFDVAMGKLLDASSPCYVFYRLDSVNSFGSDWIFICYVPESSDVGFGWINVIISLQLFVRCV